MKKKNSSSINIRTFVVRQSKWSSDPAEQLKEFRQELLRERERDRDETLFQLHLLVVDITPRALDALVDLLNAVGEEETTTGSTIKTKKMKKWHTVYLRQCRILKRSFPSAFIAATTSTDISKSQNITKEEVDFLPQDLHRLGITLSSSRISALMLEESPQVVDCLLNHAPQLYTTKLSIQRRSGVLTALQCLRLGALVRKSQDLRELYLQSTLLEAPDRLAVGIASAHHLEVLSLAGTLERHGESQHRHHQQQHQGQRRRHGLADLIVLSLAGTLEPEGHARNRRRRQGLADLVVSRRRSSSSSSTSARTCDTELGYGAVARLLQDPRSSHLRALNLSNLGLEDDHLVELSRLLVSCRGDDAPSNEDDHHPPPRRLEELNVSFNDIGAEGILEFAKLLPNMKTLKRVSLRPNSWDDFSKQSAQECGAALLEGVRKNTSIEYLDSLLGVPQAPLLRYYADLNWAGRRILTTSHPVPLGLWSLILERAAGTMSNMMSKSDPPPPGQASSSISGNYSAIYFLLQNSPIIA